MLGAPADPCVSATVTRESPIVMAIVTEPAEDPVRAPPGAVIALDGSHSVMPEDGVAVWTTGGESAYLGNPWQQVSATEPTSDLDDLVTVTLMPYEASDFRARLVVAASADDLPAELWPEDGSLPCERSEGDGSCDSFDVIDKNVALPEPEIGSLMLVLSAGAYTVSYASEFNGFSIPKTVLI